jgi:hypothetical protein
LIEKRAAALLIGKQDTEKDFQDNEQGMSSQKMRFSSGLQRLKANAEVAIVLDSTQHPPRRSGIGRAADEAVLNE